MKDSNEIDEGCGCPDMAPKIRIRIVRETVNKLTEQENPNPIASRELTFGKKTTKKGVQKTAIMTITLKSGDEYVGETVIIRGNVGSAKKRAMRAAEAKWLAAIPSR